MKRKGIAVAIAWLCCMVLRAQQMKEVFIHMPDSVCGILTEVNRADCVDFLASNMKAEVTNRYGRPSELKVLTDDYLYLEVTPQCTWEMKLLPLADSTQVVCFVRSVCGPVCDSRVAFYTTAWQPLDAAAYLQWPEADLFFSSIDSLQADSVAEWRKEAVPTFLKVALQPDDRSLTVSYTTMDFVQKETAEKLKSFLKSSALRYRWRDGRFVLEER